MDTGFQSVVEIGQNFMTKDNGEQIYAKACRDTLFQEVTDHHNQKDGFKEAQKLDPYWNLQPVACMVNTELKLEFGLSILGQNFSSIK